MAMADSAHGCPVMGVGHRLGIRCLYVVSSQPLNFDSLALEEGAFVTVQAQLSDCSSYILAVTEQMETSCLGSSVSTTLIKGCFRPGTAPKRAVQYRRPVAQCSLAQRVSQTAATVVLSTALLAGGMSVLG